MDNGIIIIGDALKAAKRIPDNYVDCCVTSPPYYGLRDYGVEGQLGQEKTPEEYIDKLVLIFREVKRTLATDGTLWVNISDSYAGSGKGRNADGTHNNKTSNKESEGQRNGKLLKTLKSSGCKSKDLIGIPWLLALALRNDGWYLRQDIIWQKPNAMPESVKDRCTRSHEYIFLLSKSKSYYYDAKAIMEPCVNGDLRSPNGSKGTRTQNEGLRKQDAVGNRRYTGFNERYKLSGKRELRNKRDVWSIATKGFHGAHFATFPEELITPCILAGCPEKGVVLDPFFGSGTTGAVALKNNRRFIGIELNEEYAKISSKRTGVELCRNCTYNSNDYICRPECGGCNGYSNYIAKELKQNE